MNRRRTEPYTIALTITACLLFLAAAVMPATARAAGDYLSTGLGIKSRQPHPEYPLKLEFSQRSGNYIAEVDVAIYRDGSRIQSIHSEGPWLFVDLEPGNYSVVAEYNGRKQGTRFTISEGEKQQRVILSWPQK